MTGYVLTLDIDGANVAGDLTVTGFCTARTATEVGMVFSDALRTHYPGAQVRGTVIHPARPAQHRGVE